MQSRTVTLSEDATLSFCCVFVCVYERGIQDGLLAVQCVHNAEAVV